MCPSPRYKPRVRKLRRESTPYEQALWPHLRAHRFEGFKFRRQHAIEPFIVDFACSSMKLAIELDGAGHQDQLDYDADRDAFLVRKGWSVLRFGNHEVESMLHPVLETIWAELMRLSDKTDFPSP